MPVFAGASVARSVLEATGLALWLLDPAIDSQQRISRNWTLALESIWELNRLPVKVRPDDISERENKIRSGAETMNLEWHPSDTRRPAFIGKEHRLRYTVAAQLALENDDFGKLTYSMLSAISHGTGWGLFQYISLAKEQEAHELSATGAMNIHLEDIARVLGATTYAYANAAEMELTFFGWDDDSWADVKSRTLMPYFEYLRSRET